MGSPHPRPTDERFALSLVVPEPLPEPPPMNTALPREASVAASPGPRYASDAFTTSADGTRIHHYTVGDGSPALVCCDGLGCDGYVWRYITERFSARHRVVRFHYRAHGASDAPADPSHMRVSDLCDDLEAVMAATARSRELGRQ